MNVLRLDTAPLIAGKLVVGNSGLGVLASDVPTEGEDGPGFASTQVTALGLASESVRAEILEFPATGIFAAYEDTSFSFVGDEGTHTFTYQLYVDGISTGNPQIVSLTFGSGGIDWPSIVVGDAPLDPEHGFRTATVKFAVRPTTYRPIAQRITVI